MSIARAIAVDIAASKPHNSIAATYQTGEPWYVFSSAHGAPPHASAGLQVYPAALQFISKGGANILSILWFGMLWLLGIDSMFALVEGVATVITDTPRFRHLSK